MENHKKTATFIERLFAYFIDVITLTAVITILVFPFVAEKKNDIEKIENQTIELLQKYYNNEISANTYITEYSSLSYQLNQYKGIEIIIEILVYILYFIVFQFYNKGQTIGKKLLRIRVNSLDNELTMNQLIVRNLLINSILLNMVHIVILSFVTDANTYFYIISIFMLLSWLFVIACALMIIFSKNRRGLHDYLVKTEVVRV